MVSDDFSRRRLGKDCALPTRFLSQAICVRGQNWAIYYYVFFFLSLSLVLCGVTYNWKRLRSCAQRVRTMLAAPPALRLPWAEGSADGAVSTPARSRPLQALSSAITERPRAHPAPRSSPRQKNSRQKTRTDHALGLCSTRPGTHVSC